MGSLYAKPKMPDPITYAPVAAPSTAVGAPVASSSAALSGGDDSAGAESAKIAEAVRRHSLPETILTSFRGVLSPGDWVPQRKSLLGE
jgi:hypothetical protein